MKLNSFYSMIAKVGLGEAEIIDVNGNEIVLMVYDGIDGNHFFTEAFKNLSAFLVNESNNEIACKKFDRYEFDNFSIIVRYESTEE